MKKIKYSISAIVVLLMLSCEKVLEENPLSLATADSRFSTPEGIVDGLNGIYPSLRVYYGREESLALTVLGTDTYTNGFGGQRNTPEFNAYASDFNGSTRFINSLWSGFYRGINSANTIIERVQDVNDLLEGEKNAFEAEARFLRAIIYFHLVRQFGAVHFTLEETQGVELEAFRTPEETIYQDGIIPDLEFAIANLPDVQGDHGRPAKAAARGMLARVYSTLGEQWAQVESLAEEVIADPEYGGQLPADFARLWDIDNQINDEIVWSIQYTDNLTLNGGGNRSHLLFTPTYQHNPAMNRDLENGRAFQRYMPTSYTLELYDRSIDSRFDGSFKTVWFANREATINGLPVQVGDTAIYMVTAPVDDAIQASKPYWLLDYNGKFTGADDVASSRQTPAGEIGGELRYYPSSKKFVDPTRETINAVEGQRNWPEMRLAEMYLLAAEAEFQQGRTGEAAEHINAVRRRAAWPGMETDMEITAGDVNMDFILDERARELQSEGHRWYTLKRLGLFETRLPIYNPPAAGFNPDIHYVRPIPQAIIDAVKNPEDFLQNPGY